jgi:hypothetical protein
MAGKDNTKGHSNLSPEGIAADPAEFKPILNSRLDCRDCIYVEPEDYNVIGCDVYEQKPDNVLNGGKCTEKERLVQTRMD